MFCTDAHRTHRLWLLVGVIAVLSAAGPTAADTFTQNYDGNNHYVSVQAAPGPHTFRVNGISSHMYTEWYAASVHHETDESWWGNGYWDPSFDYFVSGTVYVEANVYDGDWNWICYLGWNVTVDTTPPSVPTISSPSNGTETNDCTVYVNWNDSWDSGTGVHEYEIQVDDSSSFTSPAFQATPSASNDTTSCLSDDFYYVRVRAIDDAGNESSWSNVRTFRVDRSDPNAPVLSSPGDHWSTGSRRPTFSWSPAYDPGGSGVDYYEIRIYDWSPAWGDIEATTSGTSFTPSQDLPFDTLYWKVRAIDDAGNVGSWSDEWEVTIADNVPPTTPTPASPANTSLLASCNVALDWLGSSDSGSGVDDYQVVVDDSPAFTSPAYTSTPSNSAATTSCLADGSFYWRVRARDEAGNWSSWSATWSFTVDTAGPNAPLLLTPGNGSSTTDTRPLFAWSSASDPAGISHYEFHIDGGLFGWDGFTATTFQTSITPSQDLPYDDLAWKVCAVDLAGNIGPWSTSFSLTVVDATGELYVMVIDQNGNPAPDAVVELYDGEWTPIDQEIADGSGAVSWPDLASGEYRLEAYSNGEYWVNDGPFTVSGSQPVNVTLQRNEPYATDYAAALDGQDASAIPVPSGSALDIDVITSNDSPVARTTRVTVDLDRSQDGTVDVTGTSTPMEIAAGGSMTHALTLTPIEAGTHYRRIRVETLVNGAWALTDSWPWGEPIEVVQREATITLLDPPTGQLVRGTDATTTVQIMNTGQQTRRFWVGLSFSHESTTLGAWPFGWYDIRPIESDLLAPGETQDITFSFTIPTNLSPGQYYAIACIWDDFLEDEYLMDGRIDSGDAWHDDPDRGMLSFTLGAYQAPLDDLTGQIQEMARLTLLEGADLWGMYHNGDDALKPLFYVQAGVQIPIQAGPVPLLVEASGSFLVDLADLFEITPEGQEGLVTVWIDTAGHLGVGSGLLTGEWQIGVIEHEFDYAERALADDRRELIVGANLYLPGFTVTLVELSDEGGVSGPHLEWNGSNQVSLGIDGSAMGLISFEVPIGGLRDAINNGSPADLGSWGLDLALGIADLIAAGATADDGSWPLIVGDWEMLRLGEAWTPDDPFAHHFYVDVPTGASELQIITNGGTGNADVYVRYGERPSVAQYDLVSALPGNDEYIEVSLPQPGRWYVMMPAIDPYDGVSIVAVVNTTPDTEAPQAQLQAGPITSGGGSTHGFDVTYSDNLAIDVSTVGSGDVIVTGPGGFSQVAGLTGVDDATNGTPRVASYEIAAPGGQWGYTDNGTYTVAVQAGEVLDVHGNALAAGALGTFAVMINPPQPTGVYIGPDNGRWFDASNWQGGLLPVSSTDVAIPVRVRLDQGGAVAGSVNVLDGGTLVLEGGDVTAATITISTGGTVAGDGAITGDVLNDGMIDPGSPVSSLLIDGKYTQTPSGVLILDLAGQEPEQHDALEVTGAAELDGMLACNIIGPFAPIGQEDFTILIANEVLGSFAQLDLAGLAPSLVSGIDTTGDQTVELWIRRRADINRDRVVNVSDLLQLLAEWGTCPADEPCPSDVNGDGFMDGEDWYLIAAEWDLVSP